MRCLLFKVACKILLTFFYSDLENQLDKLRQHLNEKCVEVQNLEQLNSEIEKNLEEARNM